MKAYIGYNVLHMLNGIVIALRVITMDPLVRHAACHSQAIKNPGEQRHAI